MNMTMRNSLIPALAASLLLGLAGSAYAAGKSNGVLPGGNSKEPISIDATKLDYFDKEQKMIYSGNVVAVQGESRLKCSVLVIYLEGRGSDGAGKSADKKPGDSGDSAPSASSSRVKRMEAAGPVTVISKDQVGTGNSGVYDKAENKVYLYGNVTLSQGTNVTKGDKLVYDLTTTKAVVDSGNTGRVKSVFTPDGDDKKKPAKPKDNAAAPSTN